jgi:RHS repeat-associated protein
LKKVVIKDGKTKTNYYLRDAQGNVLSVYRKTQRDVGSFFFWEEQHLYGSSRLGIERTEQSIRDVVSSDELSNEITLAYEKWGKYFWTNLKQQYEQEGRELTQTLYENWGDLWEYRMNLITTAPRGLDNGFLLSRVANESAPILLGKKQYELSNHLGNVLAVVSDKKLYHPKTGWMAQVLTAQDYYPFGMTMGGTNGRYYTAGEKYRYSFNGKEDDTESGIQDYGMRMYDKSIGRFLSVDPLTDEYPFYSPYQFASNTPILAVDVDGLESSEVPNWTEKFEEGFEKGFNDIPRAIIHNIEEALKSRYCPTGDCKGADLITPFSAIPTTIEGWQNLASAVGDKVIDLWQGDPKAWGEVAGSALWGAMGEAEVGALATELRSATNVLDDVVVTASREVEICAVTATEEALSKTNAASSSAKLETPLAQPGEDLYVGTYRESYNANTKSGLKSSHTPHHAVQHAVGSKKRPDGVTINLDKKLHEQTGSYKKMRKIDKSMQHPNNTNIHRVHLSKDIRELRELLKYAGYSQQQINKQLKELIKQNKANGGFEK